MRRPGRAWQEEMAFYTSPLSPFGDFPEASHDHHVSRSLLKPHRCLYTVHAAVEAVSKELHIMSVSAADPRYRALSSLANARSRATRNGLLMAVLILSDLNGFPAKAGAPTYEDQ